MVIGTLISYRKVNEGIALTATPLLPPTLANSRFDLHLEPGLVLLHRLGELVPQLLSRQSRFTRLLGSASSITHSGIKASLQIA